MRKIIFTIELSLICFFSVSPLMGQEKSNKLMINGIVENHFKKETQNFSPFSAPEGYYNLPLSPGGEIIYFRQIKNGVEIGTGITLMKIHFSSFVDYIRRFNYNEISIPVFARKNFIIKNKSQLYFTTGIYFGKEINIFTDIPLSAGWIEWEDKSTIEGYSDDVFWGDIYLDVGYSISVLKNSSISLSPYFKYRFNSTWLNHHQLKTIIGAKISYSLKF